MKKYLLLLVVCFVLLPFVGNGQIITTVAGGGTGAVGSGDGGPATAARLGWFYGLAIDKYGNVYIADANNQRIRKVDVATGIITTVAGTGSAGFSGDGGPATAAQFNLPSVVAFDTAGNFYIGDANNNRIRKVDITTGIVTTFAGTGTLGFSGDGGAATAAQIADVMFAIDSFNNMYIADGTNYRVRKINSSGVISTIAGTGYPGSTGDGGLATSATFNVFLGICVSRSGSKIWVQDNWTSAIRKIDISSGIVTRVAGAGDSIQTPYSGDGTVATVAHIGSFGIAVDDSDNLFIADQANHRIEKVDGYGIIHTIAGNGTSGFSGDGGAAISAQLNWPENITFDNCGNLYVADANNKRVRKVTFPPIATDTPSLSIISSTSDTICTGASATYTATFTHGGSITTYQWYVNSTAIGGATNTTYTYSPSNGDSVQCRIVTIANACSSPSYGSSNVIHMVVNPLVTPAIAISASPGDTICAGTSVTFMAATTYGGSSPVYHWFVNGSAVGGSLSSYTYTPANGDSVRCVLTSNYPCLTVTEVGSNVIYMVVNPFVTPTIVITPSPNDTVCGVTSVTFTATITSGGTAPAYQWKVNGSNVGSGTSTYTYTPNNGDSVRCVLTSNADCASPTTVSSNTIDMMVASIAHPAVTLSGPVVVSIGSPVTITATVTGAGSSYVLRWMNYGTVFATTSIPSVTYTKTLATDSITAKVVSDDFCYDSTTSGWQVVWDHDVSVRNLQLAVSSLHVYPNPVNSVLYVECKTVMHSVAIINILGQSVIKSEGGERRAVVPVGQLAAGVYILEVVGEDGGIYREKIVRE